MIESARPGPLSPASIESPLRSSEPSTRIVAAGDEVAVAGEGVLGVVGDAALELGADHEQHERQRQPAGDRERDPLDDPLRR